MLYLLDASTLITAEADYYPMERIPQFWDWLISEGASGRVKIPFEIHAEITPDRGDFRAWINGRGTKEALILPEAPDRVLVQQVLDDGYGLNVNEAELELIGADAFLIAYCLAANDRVVVTHEASKPKRERANRHIPDVCARLQVPCIGAYEFYRQLHFTTKP